LLDDPGVDAALATRSLRDVARSNVLFGGQRAVLTSLTPLLEQTPRGAVMVMLDVGTGLGDIPHAVRAHAQRRGTRVITFGLELTAALASAARARAQNVLCGDARVLPFATGSIDVVTCSQVLHHFDGPEADALLRELTRVAKRLVIVSDLRRSWLAVGLLWLVSFPLRFHPVSRHDGIVSILRGYTASELDHIVHRAVDRTPAVHNRLGWRVTAAWSPR
jgi:ubiquinone/menaquinone biosynthesis C-methylase UbiE